MLKNTTMNLPDELVAKVEAYAARHRTTVTAIVREHFEVLEGGGGLGSPVHADGHFSRQGSERVFVRLVVAEIDRG